MRILLSSPSMACKTKRANGLFEYLRSNKLPHAELNPHPLDPPEHLLRIRLVCTLLQTCGDYFHRGLSMRKLDCFLVYFQVCGGLRARVVAMEAA